MFKPKKVKIAKHKVQGRPMITCFDIDPLSGEKLIDPYYIEHYHYRIGYNMLMSRIRAGLASDSEKNALMVQPGPQWYFLRNDADIIIYGGAAGAGKTFAITLLPLKHQGLEAFNTIIFRKTQEDCRKPGGPLTEATGMYMKIPGVDFNSRDMQFKFPYIKEDGTDDPNKQGMNVKYDGLEHDSKRLAHQGAQYENIIFDELTHFSEILFTYLVSRNRSRLGHPCRVKATTNPETGSWVRKWLDWFLWPTGSVYPHGYMSPTGEDLSGQPSGGLPINERSGKKIYYVNVDSTPKFATTKQELFETFGEGVCGLPAVPENNTPAMPMGAIRSFTFISASVYDNPKMLMNNPQYIAGLKSMSKVEREGLLGGNWDSTVGSGLYFKREWIKQPKDGLSRVIPRLPNIPLAFVRYWDRAATEPSQVYPNPDWTVGTRMAKDQDGNTYICSLARDRKNPAGVEKMLRTEAQRDGTGCPLWVEQDPGSGGKIDVHNIMTKFSQYPVRVHRPTKDKLTKGLAFSAACENGLVYFVQGAYLETLFHEMENFDNDGKKKDDQWDSVTGGYNVLAQGNALLFNLDEDFNDEFIGDGHFMDQF